MQQPGSRRDPYRGVVIVLLAAALLGTAAAVYGGFALGNPVVLDTAVTLGLSASVLVGLALTQAARAKPPKPKPEAPTVAPSRPMASSESAELSAPAALSEPAEAPAPTPVSTALRVPSVVSERVLAWVSNWSRDLEDMGSVRIATGVAGLVIIVLLLRNPPLVAAASLTVYITAATLCLVSAGLAGTAARYFADSEPAVLPEAVALCRGARVVAWMLVLAALSVGLAWAGQDTTVRIFHALALTVNAAIAYSLLTATRSEDEPLRTFRINLGVLSVLGGRPNVLASILDAAERQLGIDLRSTWALTVVRHSVEPVIIALFLLGWLSTSLTVVGLEEQGLVERLGVPVGGPPLEPGLHLQWPWPVDQVFRIPVKRVQILTVGHEGEEEGGPENVLWAVQHAANEYTLLLGNGRDLITIDAAVQFRIADARAWRYHSQNPADALRATAYRAVMRDTVNRTLADALSENVVTTTAHMRTVVQQDADALGLGVEVMGFTVGGMHPPVPVASAYQAVVSAEVGKVTAVMNAQALRNMTVPFAETAVLVGENSARAEGADALGRAAGEAWSFLTLQAQYRAAPEEYFFRRRLETLEQGLAGRRFTVVDARFQRDGGELWVMP